MNREGKKCVLYPRVSTEMQVDGYSLEGQKNGLKRFADREEMEIVGIYEDAGKSGKSIEGRPAFKKMLSDIKNGLEIDYILVYKLSRFGRNAADILNSLEFVQSYGINLICIEEGIDSSQTSGKLLISVLSAVAEIERENIIEQTMNGRREKARQGGWNGGFAPYGYYLKDNQLLIEETEAEAIRIIFDKFANSDIGLGGVAKYLNLQGIKKIPRQNGTLETWSSHFIRLILDNPVYCGKIAYGRRTREKVKGTKNEYKQVHAEDYILEDGQHEGIISEELWQKVHAKRMATGIKQPSKIGKDRSHLLTGILKCPLCGSSMYTNKHAWTNKDGTYKEVYYYICGRNKQERGHHCDYKASLRKTDIEPLVIEAVKELVSDKYFAKEIEKRIGVQTDTTAIDKELANYESKLKEVDLNKARLEREIDNLPVDTRFRERKIHDMTLRLDALYDTIVELEERIEDAKLRKSSIEMETITLDNIYKLMLNFGKLYDIISDEEKKSLITYLIKEIQIYPNGESEQPLKSIEFNFPIYRDGQEVRRLLWEKGNTVETFVLLDADDRILLPSILYADARGVEECAVFAGRHTEQITGVAPGYLFSLPKIMWVKKHHPKAYEEAKRILLMQDFVVYMLTGTAQIDYSLATRTMGFDIRKKCWSKTMFYLAGVEMEKMSKPVPSGTIAGKSDRFGLSGAVIVSGCLDQVAAAVGAGAREPFCAMDGIGTVECVLPVLKEIPDSRQFYRGGYAVIPYVGDDQYVCCVLSFSGGAAIKWFRDRIAPGIGYDALNGAVNTETPTGILLLPHFGGAATPYMDSESKAAMVGITYQTGREEIYQAVLEGISYEMRLNLDEAEKNGVRVERVIATGGGAKSRELLQIKANIYRRPVTALMADEVGAVGTMMLTAVAVHAYENLEQAGNALIAEKETFYPNAAAAERYEIMYQKYRGLYQAVRPLVHNIKEEEQ